MTWRIIEDSPLSLSPLCIGFLIFDPTILQYRKFHQSRQFSTNIQQAQIFSFCPMSVDALRLRDPAGSRIFC